MKENIIIALQVVFVIIWPLMVLAIAYWINPTVRGKGCKK